MTNLIHDGMREKSSGTGGVVGSYFYSSKFHDHVQRYN